MVVGSNPGTVYWTDIFSSYIFCKNYKDVCLKRMKINEKEAGRSTSIGEPTPTIVGFTKVGVEDF